MLKGLLGLRDEGGGGESGSSKVELAENKLILSQFYFTLFPFPSIQMDHNRFTFEFFFFSHYNNYTQSELPMVYP